MWIGSIRIRWADDNNIILQHSDDNDYDYDEDDDDNYEISS